MRQITTDKLGFLPWSKEKNWPSRRLIICKVYEKPEEYGSLILPKPFLEDKSGTLWEVVKVSEGAKRALGTDEIREGDIIKIRGHEFPTGLGLVDERDLKHLVAIDAEKVYQVYFVN